MILIVCIWLELVVVGKVLYEENTDWKAAYTQKRRFENLDRYKNIMMREGQSLIIYRFLYFMYRQGLKIGAAIFLVMIIF